MESDDDGAGDGPMGGPLAPAPAPAPVPVSSPTAGNPGAAKPSAIQRIKRRMELMEEQLASTQKQLVLEREEHEMDVAELKEQSATLQLQLQKAVLESKKAGKKAAAAEASLAGRKQSEQKEAKMLEDFTARVEKNLEQTTARANAAEAKQK